MKEKRTEQLHLLYGLHDDAEKLMKSMQRVAYAIRELTSQGVIEGATDVEQSLDRESLHLEDMVLRGMLKVINTHIGLFCLPDGEWEVLSAGDTWQYGDENILEWNDDEMDWQKCALYPPKADNENDVIIQRMPAMELLPMNDENGTRYCEHCGKSMRFTTDVQGVDINLDELSIDFVNGDRNNRPWSFLIHLNGVPDKEINVISMSCESAYKLLTIIQRDLLNYEKSFMDDGLNLMETPTLAPSGDDNEAAQEKPPRIDVKNVVQLASW